MTGSDQLHVTNNRQPVGLTEATHLVMTNGDHRLCCDDALKPQHFYIPIWTEI